MKQTFTLPFPPSGNHRLRVGVVKGKPAFFKTSEYRRFEALCGVALTEQKIKPYRADLRLSCAIELYPPDKRIRDIDGAIKCVWDTLETKGIIANDFAFWHLDLWRKEELVKPDGRVKITIDVLNL